MKNSQKFLECMSEIDDELIIRADDCSVEKKKSRVRMKWVIIAAVLGLVLAVSLTVAIFSIKEGLKNGNESEDVLQVPISDV